MLPDLLDAPTATAEATCAHCGLPAGPAPSGAGDGAPVAEAPAFCCVGCSIVYEALRGAGLADGYYRARRLGEARPAKSVRASPEAAALDTPGFLERETTAVTGGGRRVTLALDGVHCAACVWLVERLPFEMDGVQAARLDLARGRLSLTFDPLRVRLSDVAAWLARFGYEARALRRDGTARNDAAERRLLVRVGVAWALAGNAMLLAFALYSGLDLADASTEGTGALAAGARWTSALLATASMAVAGPEFFRRAWASLRQAARARSVARLHMDLPIALGIAGGYAYSLWATLAGRGDVWFDSLMVLMAALLTARYLQLRARRLAGDASERLLALVPPLARRLNAAGSVETVEAATLVAGEHVEVLPGEVVPVDGVVESGRSALDRAILTGESRPEVAGAGTAVEAGTTNLTARLVVRVAAAGENTRVGRLLAYVREGDAARAPAALMADRIAGAFVAFVIVVAALALGFGGAGSVERAVAVLVIACPCALGMATPLAFAVAAGRAARAGIFVKREDVFELLPRATAVVLDKTGTLTEGRMVLAAWAGESDAVALAAALERGHAHPIARALADARPDARALPDAAGVEAEAGNGLSGWVGARHVRAGRPGWHARPDDDADLTAALERYAADGLTPVAVRLDGRLAAALGVGDRLRAEASALVARLVAEGRAVYLLSGDHPDVVARVAAALGLPPERARGGVSPEAKREAVAALAARGTVVMVGDGVNDAAALGAAHVGVAVGGGTMASQMAAGVFAVRPGLAPIVALFDGSRRVVRTVRAGLALSLLYNVAGAIAALFGYVTPLVAAVAMPLSSLAVITLALTQRSFREVRGARSEVRGPGSETQEAKSRTREAPARPSPLRSEPYPRPSVL